MPPRWSPSRSPLQFTRLTDRPLNQLSMSSAGAAGRASAAAGFSAAALPATFSGTASVPIKWFQCLIFEPPWKTFEKINKTSIVSKNVPWSKDFSDRMTASSGVSLFAGFLGTEISKRRRRERVLLNIRQTSSEFSILFLINYIFGYSLIVKSTRNFYAKNTPKGDSRKL